MPDAVRVGSLKDLSSRNAMSMIAQTRRLHVVRYSHSIPDDGHDDGDGIVVAQQGSRDGEERLAALGFRQDLAAIAAQQFSESSACLFFSPSVLHSIEGWPPGNSSSIIRHQSCRTSV